MASRTPKPVKGILKKPKTTAGDKSQEPASSTPSDPRAIALHHARLLQDRKDIEALIFNHILTLLDLPLHPSHQASSPHPADIETFLSLVRIFQPSDYDDLITERNLNENKCGYTLCPNQRRRYKGAGTYKMVNKGRKDFDIVETKELEKWCSTECTRRALWVKVQLNETAAWERVGLPELRVELYPEEQKDKSGSGSSHAQRDSEGEPQRLATEMARLQLDQDRKIAKHAAALALERGDGAEEAPGRSVDIVVREKKVTTEPEAPSLADNTIEGYKSRFGSEAEGGPALEKGS
ncbi:hypothetical protein M406DRAFT_289249 [Cryphonectria parasitica EP155]|uniref:RNA polymerase II subunit B1 CTD phosphatase RPAP2 homolog n=1 Tax=Cryphonectria parasitica (strain ATCC 38755 / EP155) TaxID=660469 RepID=A0A9P5CR77_CRYP1|nr:uncharacterized protein M406DRAFT_289249 [Cryphonectria parasitica EP155]KAF3767973.1 hypothetical protein M406DRAFT_289249 [Cryphonectria parasitica EP155]